jgi:hypothetical protein
MPFLPENARILYRIYIKKVDLGENDVFFYGKYAVVLHISTEYQHLYCGFCHKIRNGDIKAGWGAYLWATL